MKKVVSLLFALLMLTGVAALTACGGENDSASGTTNSLMSRDDLPMEDPNLPETALEIDEVLNDDQIDLYYRAQAAFENFDKLTGFGGYVDDQTPTVEQDGQTYYQSNGQYTTWEEYETAMLEIFTPEYLEKLNANNTYIDVDGDLYYIRVDSDGDMRYAGPDFFEKISTAEDRVEFNVLGSYDENEDSDNLVYKSFLIVMVNTEDGWRVDQFAATH